MENEIFKNRMFLKCPDFSEESTSDQDKGVSPPPIGLVKGGQTVDLPDFAELKIDSYKALLDIRRSERVYAETPISGAQLAFLLWSVQGIQGEAHKQYSRRPVPSGGARHAFETYIFAKNVDGLPPAIYHYLPTANTGAKKVTLEFISNTQDADLTKMLVGQAWAERAAATLFFTAVPYRAEWRYTEHAHRVILIDLGHVGQNAMLSASALGLGSCCVAAFDNKICDPLFRANGLEELTVYAITVGVPARRKG